MCQALRQIRPELGESLAKTIKSPIKTYLLLLCCYIRVTRNGGPSSQFN